jgi:hypothetical protein
MSAESEAKKLSVLVVMGVSGAGKSTIAALLALRLRWTYEDADWFHPPSNIEKMHCGGRGSIGSRCAIRRRRGGRLVGPGGLGNPGGSGGLLSGVGSVGRLDGAHFILLLASNADDSTTTDIRGHILIGNGAFGAVDFDDADPGICADNGVGGSAGDRPGFRRLRDGHRDGFDIVRHTIIHLVYSGIIVCLCAKARKCRLSEIQFGAPTGTQLRNLPAQSI